jgi:hypothetical protein
VDPATAVLAGAWALVDVLQIPLIAAVLVSWRLTRRLGRAWKATAVGFGLYTLWVIVTALVVPFAPSGFLLVVIGTLLVPWRGASPEHAWAIGSAAGLVLFWLVPVGIVWTIGRRPASSPGRHRAPAR